MRIGLALGGMATAMLAGTGAAAQATHSIPSSKLPFQVDLPPGFTVEGYDGPDFSVYYLRKGGATYLGAYDGFAPSLGTAPPTS